jgi:hypothetical protein
MVKIALIAVVCLAWVLPVHGQQEGAKTSRQHRSSKQPAQSDSPGTGPQPTTVINQYASAEYAKGTTDHPNGYFARLFSPENLPNIALVVIGVVASIIALCTLRPIRNQARAALLSAQAVLDAERPWFVASIERTRPQFDFWRVRITNKGRTPGQLWDLSENFMWVPSPEAEHFPMPPCYDSPGSGPNTRFYASAESFIVGENPVNDDGFLPVDRVNNRRQEFGENMLEFLVVYGRVTYKDTFTGRTPRLLHESRWCYLFRPPVARNFLGDFVACGPAEYNGYRDYEEGEQKAN